MCMPLRRSNEQTFAAKRDERLGGQDGFQTLTRQERKPRADDQAHMRTFDRARDVRRSHGAADADEARREIVERIARIGRHGDRRVELLGD